MQDLFAELGAIRAAADPKRFPPDTRQPVANRAVADGLFLIFPDRADQARRAGALCHAPPSPIPCRSVTHGICAATAPTRRIFEPLADIEKVAAAVEAAASDGAASTTIAEATGISVLRVERCLLWLLKYDYVERGAG